MTSDAVMDKVVDELKGVEFELIASNMSSEEEQGLLAAFGA
jgi:uncharacterized membrane protein